MSYTVPPLGPGQLRYLLSVPGLKVRGGGQGNALRRVNTEEREHIIVLGLGWIPGSV